jgi:hypothetical protein
MGLNSKSRMNIRLNLKLVAVFTEIDLSAPLVSKYRPRGSIVTTARPRRLQIQRGNLGAIGEGLSFGAASWRPYVHFSRSISAV